MSSKLAAAAPCRAPTTNLPCSACRACECTKKQQQAIPGLVAVNCLCLCGCSNHLVRLWGWLVHNGGGGARTSLRRCCWRCLGCRLRSRLWSLPKSVALATAGQTGGSVLAIQSLLPSALAPPRHVVNLFPHASGIPPGRCPPQNKNAPQLDSQGLFLGNGMIRETHVKTIFLAGLAPPPLSSSSLGLDFSAWS